MAERGGRWRVYGVAGGVLLLDRLTKWLVEHHLGDWETHTVIPGFCNLLRTENRGAAFSLLAGIQAEWRSGLLIVLTAAAVVVISGLLWRSEGALQISPVQRFSLALILGGAAGNLHDRLVRGAVTDFLELYVGQFRWPAFNVADAAITVGALATLWDLWRMRRAARRA